MTRITHLLTFAVIGLAALGVAVGQELPTTYEYFTEGGIVTGLTADAPGFFKLNGRELRIVSGAIHYFRVHPGQWRDRLQKLRALGANAVETYVAWNLHEPEPGVFDFNGGLDLRRFVEIAQEEDLLLILRPGPYICAEFEFGGLPVWLQADREMQVRTAYPPYLERARLYLDRALQQVVDLQFTNGGPIIAIQIENEYGHYRQVSKEYLAWIKSVFEENGFGDSLPFTSDNIQQTGANGALEGVLMTSNLQTDAPIHLNRLLEFQPSRPVMVAEYWAGWFDTWFGPHSVTDPAEFAEGLETIFAPPYNGSVNFYMFLGGTNFGFTAGATDTSEAPFYSAFVTSYDYNAPLSEAGEYTEKYYRAQALIERYQVPALRRPPMPPPVVKVAYPSVVLQGYLSYNDILARVPASARFSGVPRPVAMEELNMNSGGGQGFGFIVYRKVVSDLGAGTRLRVGPVRDVGLLLVDGEVEPLPVTHASPYWINEEVEFALSLDSARSYLVDVLVECAGHLNWIQTPDFRDMKGIPNGNISIDGVPLSGFQIIALELKSEWVVELANWRPVPEASASTPRGPAMFRATFEISGSPTDTFLDMRGWHKGVVWVNGFNIGRYFRVGPQQTLYIPAPALRGGVNTVTVFELLEPGNEIRFSSEHILDQNEETAE